MPFDCIAINPGVCQANPRVRGTRITVEFVLKLMASGYSENAVVCNYPEIALADVRQCAEYQPQRDD